MEGGPDDRDNRDTGTLGRSSAALDPIWGVEAPALEEAEANLLHSAVADADEHHAAVSEHDSVPSVTMSYTLDGAHSESSFDA